jgi:hypothetical protein
MHQKRGSAAALDNGADCRPARPDDQVPFPVAGDGSVLGLGGALAQDDIGGDVSLRLVPRPGPRFSQRPARAQTRDQFTLERASPLDEQGLVDRLVADAHGLIIGEVDLQPMRDLLRTPRRRPTPVLTMGLVQPLPRRCLGARDDRAVKATDIAGKPVPHVLAQPFVTCQLRRFRRFAACCAFHCATTARYTGLPPLVAALRRSSRDTVAGSRPIVRAISRTPLSWALSSAISSLSTNDKYRPVGSSRLSGVIPPACRNQRIPTGDDTPTPCAAWTVVTPEAISRQKSR